jgi:hypothetical protein
MNKTNKKYNFIYFIFFILLNNYIFVNFLAKIIIQHIKNITRELKPKAKEKIKVFGKNIKKEFKPKNLFYNFAGSLGLEYAQFKYNQFAKNLRNNNNDLNKEDVKDIFANAFFGTILGAIFVGPVLNIIAESKRMDILKKNIAEKVVNKYKKKDYYHNIIIKDLTVDQSATIHQNFTKIIYSKFFNQIRNSEIFKQKGFVQKKINSFSQEVFSEFIIKEIIAPLSFKNILRYGAVRNTLKVTASNQLGGLFDTTIAIVLYSEENKELNLLKVNINETKKKINYLFEQLDGDISKTKPFIIRQSQSKKNELRKKYQKLEAIYEKYIKSYEEIEDISKKEINSKKYDSNINDFLEEIKIEKEWFDSYIKFIREKLEKLEVF